MQISEILTKDLELIVGQASICEAARVMREKDIGMLPVVQRADLVGTMTDRDLAIRGIAEGLDPLTTKVGEVMTANAKYCYEDDWVNEAAEMMERNRIRRLPVLNRNNRLVGVVSLSDLVVRGNDETPTGKVLEQVCA